MSRFRSISVSSREFECEGLRHLGVKSPELSGRGDITLFLPDPCPRDVPLTILLHGVSGSHWDWTLKGGVHRTCASLIASGALPPMALAMPSDGLLGDGTGYLAHHGRDFGRWISHDVVDAAREAIPEITLDSALFLGGLSMGGFGALSLVARNPHRFRGAAGLSSVTHFHQLLDHMEEPVEAFDVPESHVDLADLLIRNRASLPSLFVLCGTADPLLEANRLLHVRLEQNGVTHHYAESPGGHDWGFWRTKVGEVLRFFARTL